jgi:putative ABC transport system permease protein
MTLRDFRIGWRVLLKEAGYSMAVVGGLAVGLGACFLLLGFVRYCFSYNEAIADSERIFVVKERRNFLPRPDWVAAAPPPLRDIASASGPGVTATAAKSFDLAARIDNRVVPLRVQVVDANFLDFFGVAAIAGDARAALARPDALVLSRQMATKLFGQADALGKRLQIDGATFEVHAILPDPPANTSVSFDALVGAGAHSWDRPSSRPGA